MLRGNWAHELVAVQRAFGGRVLLVPALPRLDRVCRGGVVHVGGAPVGGPDARRASSSPRPAEHLTDAGAADVAELADAAAVRAWAADGGTFAVCDASSDDDLDAIADVWRGTDVRFAGTAGSIAAAVAATAVRGCRRRPWRWPATSSSCAAACTRRHGRSSTPSAPGAIPPSPSSPRRGRMDRRSPRRAPTGSPPSSARPPASCWRRGRFGVLVIVGGDTAAAVLGDEPLIAGGTLAPGVPWARRGDGRGPLVVTKAGGFGHATTLVDLLAGRSPSEGR